MRVITLLILLTVSITNAQAQLKAGDLLKCVAKSDTTGIVSLMVKGGYKANGDTTMGDYTVYYYYNEHDKCDNPHFLDSQIQLAYYHKGDSTGVIITIYTDCDKSSDAFVRSFRRWGYKKTGTSGTGNHILNTYNSDEYSGVPLLLAETKNSGSYYYQFTLQKVGLD